MTDGELKLHDSLVRALFEAEEKRDGLGYVDVPGNTSEDRLRLRTQYEQAVTNVGFAAYALKDFRKKLAKGEEF
jgi:hypothetical protein